MTTVGTDEGRNYARINLKLIDRGRARARRRRTSSGDPQGAAADSRASSSPSASTGRSSSTSWGPIRRRSPRSPTTSRRSWRACRGSPTSSCPRSPPIPRCRCASTTTPPSDLGITVQQVGATLRPLLAGDTVSYWLAPDAQNYEVNVRLAKDRRQLAIGPVQPLPDDQQARARRRAADGAAAAGRGDRGDLQPADDPPRGAAAARRDLRQRAGPARPATSATTSTRSSRR